MSDDPWETLAAALAVWFDEMVEDDFLILKNGQYYVQCYQRIDDLDAEALADRADFPNPPIGTAGAQRLRELGWNPPREDDGNWWTTLDVADLTSMQRLRALADQMIATLREVYHTATPSDVRYQASNAKSGHDWDAGDLGLQPVS